MVSDFTNGCLGLTPLPRVLYRQVGARPASTGSHFMNIIELKGVSKSYPIYDSPSSRLKELLTFNNATYHKDFWALQDISIEVKRGETFCVVG